MQLDEEIRSLERAGETERAERMRERIAPTRVTRAYATVARIVEFAHDVGEIEKACAQWRANDVAGANGPRQTYSGAVLRYALARFARLGNGLARFRTNETPARTVYNSGDCRVDIKIDEQCRTCRNGKTCYRATIRVSETDWSTKVTTVRALKLRHLHLAPAFESTHAIDSPEAYREIARSSLAFGSYWDSEYGREHGVSQEMAETVSNAMGHTESGEPLLNDETFDPFAWPGGYSIVYVTRDGSTYCHECAPRYCTREQGDVHYEGSPLFCDDCNKEMPSEYGDPDEPESDNED